MQLYQFEMLRGEDVISVEPAVPLYNTKAAWPKIIKMGIPFTPATPGATIRRWKALFILFPEPIIPGPFTKWTNGSAPMPPVATMSGACGGRLDLCARNAARLANRGLCRETGSGVAPASGKQL
jgi:hypothetical protein